MGVRFRCIRIENDSICEQGKESFEIIEPRGSQVRVQRLWAIVAFTVMVFLMFGGLVSAHHSVAGYDSKKEISLRGVIVEYNWRNPDRKSVV